MLNKFIKKTYKFPIILITIISLCYTLIYATDVSNYQQFNLAIKSTSTTQITLLNDINDVTGELGTQASNSVTIIGNKYSINGLSNASGIVLGDGKILNIYKISSINNFHTNKDGAVLNSSGGYVNIDSKMVFSSNSAKNGGAIYAVKGSTTTIELNADFSSNSASGYGGAIYVNLSKLEIESGVKFNSNFAIESGGAICIENSTATIDSNVEFSSNTSTSLGGAIYNYGSKSTIGENVVFSSNTAIYGGAIFNAGTLEIEKGAIFSSNIATDSGGAIYNLGTMIIKGATFENNIAKGFGNDIYNNGYITFEENSSTFTSGGIFGHGTIIVNGINFDLRDTKIEQRKIDIKNSGILYGNTKNVTCLLSSADHSGSVEFYDNDITPVVLTSIDTENYLYNFTKFGTAEMKVVNDFKSQIVQIKEGTFSVFNEITGPEFTVVSTMTVSGQNTKLSGEGTVKVGQLIIEDGATFLPNSFTKSFKVDGNLKFDEGGIYEVQIGQYDSEKKGHYNTSLYVTQSLEISSNTTLKVNNLESKYFVEETIDILTIKPNILNEFSNIEVVGYDMTDEDLRLGPRIECNVYNDYNVMKLNVKRKKSQYSTATEFSRSSNEQEVAKSIDNISTGYVGDIANILKRLESFYYYKSTYDIGSLKEALNDMAGTVHANSTLLTFINAKVEHVYDKVKESLDFYSDTKIHDKLWAQYYYNSYSVEKDENSYGFDTNANGILVGCDVLYEKELSLGVMLGYSNTKLKQVRANSNMSDINFGFYGGYTKNEWLLRSMLLFGYENYDIDREIQFANKRATSSHSGFSTTFDLEAGYSLEVEDDSLLEYDMSIRPFLGLTASNINQEKYAESGADSLNLKVNGYSSTLFQGRFGVEIDGEIDKINWYAQLGFRQLLTKDCAQIKTSLVDFQNETTMEIKSVTMDKFSCIVGCGARCIITDSWEGFTNFLTGFSNSTTNVYFNLGATYKFDFNKFINRKNKEANKVSIQKKSKQKEISEQEKITQETQRKMIQENLLRTETAKVSKGLQGKINQEKIIKNEIMARKGQKVEQPVIIQPKENEKVEELKTEPIQKNTENIGVVNEEQAKQMKAKQITKIKLKNKPTFLFGKTELTKQGVKNLNKVAIDLKKYPNAQLLIEGHTDSRGRAKVNQKISEQRAIVIAQTLKKNYKVKNKISVIGKGSSEPIASNKTEKGREQNRRVEFIVVEEK